MPFAWILGTILLLFAVSQVYWFGRARVLFRGWIPHKTTRRVMELVCLAALLVFFALNFGAFGRRPTSIRLTAYDALVEAPWPAQWWLSSW